MDIRNHRCSSCGKSLCCETVHHAYERYQQELVALLAQPEPDRARIAFLMFLIAAIHRRFPAMKESAS